MSRQQRRRRCTPRRSPCRRVCCRRRSLRRGIETVPQPPTHKRPPASRRGKTTGMHRHISRRLIGTACRAFRTIEGPPPYRALLLSSRVLSRARSDRAFYLMPVITPCRPRLCTTHSISKATLAVVKAEISRANELASTALHTRTTSAIVATSAGAGGATPSSGSAAGVHYTSLFAPTDFFVSYHHYLGVQLTANNDAELLHWRAFVRARLHRLVRAPRPPPAESRLP